jgi:WD40 repeat protein
MTTTAKIFISYARKDGEIFAKALRAKLVAIFGEEAIWRDRDEMEGGVGWWNQIQEAIESVEFMVLVATPIAMASDVVAKEWRTARQNGVCVYPVQVPDHPINFDTLPRWMKDAHFYNLDVEWETFVNYLKHPCEALRVPFMAETPPPHFVNRPQLMDELLGRLLDKSHQNPIAITTALKGAGGFGKTTLAQALCANESVQTAFDDGVLWVTLGENPDVLLALKKVYKALTGKDGIFSDTEEGGRLLGEALTDKDCLLVIDDVWNMLHLRPFLQGGERCARLITTRDVQIAVNAKASTTEVDEMTLPEARALLRSGIAGLADSDLNKLAIRLGKWALMVEIANGMMLTRQLSTDGTWADAFTYVNRLLDRRGVMSIQTDTDTKRKQGADGVLTASLDLLNDADKTRLCGLGIFKDDQDVPVSSVMALWGMDDLDSEELLTKFARLSLIKYRSSTASIRLHDVVREYFLTKLPSIPATHDQLLRGYGDPYTLPDVYAWRFYAYHLNGAGRLAELRPLLLSYRWLDAKLRHTDPNALIEDCDLWLTQGRDEPIRLIQSAVSNSAHVLEKDKSALAHQLAGRLMHHYKTVDEIKTFWDSITPPKNSLFPINNGYDALNPAGGMMLRTMKHDDAVNGAIQLRDGRILSWSRDNTLRLWRGDGTPIVTLTGHTEVVYGATQLADGRLLSWSGDSTLRLWDVDGMFLGAITGHTDAVYGALVLADRRLVSWSADATLHLWENDGTPIVTLIGHTLSVYGVLVLAGERILSWSEDNTLRLWNSSGTALRVMIGHTDKVLGAIELSDGRILSWSEDNTLRLWQHDGIALKTLTDHNLNVYDAIELSNGHILSWSGSSVDKTLHLWDRYGVVLKTMEMNMNNGAIELSDGRILSYGFEGILYLWDSSGTALKTMTGHTGEVFGAVELSDKRILSYDSFGTLYLWDSSGTALKTMTGHTDEVFGAIELSNTRILSWGGDNTLRLWDSNGISLIPLTHNMYGVRGILRLSNGRLLSWSEDETFCILGIYGTTQMSLMGHEGFVIDAIELSDGRILSCGEDSTLRLWDNEGKMLKTIEEEMSFSTSVIELFDGRILSYDWKGMLHLWNSKGELIKTLKGHTSGVTGAIELSDRRILSWSRDNTLRLWTSDGISLATLMGHTNSVTGAIELSDGHILSWGDDKTLRLWTSNGTSLATLLEHTYEVKCAIELTDGRILSWSVSYLQREDKILQLWDVDGTPIDVLEQDYYRNDRSIIGAWAQGHGLTLDDIYSLEEDPLMTSGRVQRRDTDLIIYDSQTGATINTFYGDAPFTGGAVVLDGGRVVVAGDSAGRVIFLRWVGE